MLHDILFMRGSLEIEWLPYFKGETSISVWQTWYEQIKKIEVTEEVKSLIDEALKDQTLELLDKLIRGDI